MMMKKYKAPVGTKAVFTAAALTACLILGACSRQGEIKLDPQNPITISVWHYYNGAILSSFEKFIKEFNDTAGREKGIIVEGFAHGNVAELERAVISSANKEVGSPDMPNVFASYADTAYEAEKLGLLANLDEYFTPEEQSEYVDSYIEEGKIGLNGELRILPVAKSTEILMINETDWLPFAQANGLSYEDLESLQDITRVSEIYYNWTDAQTPDISNDGKAFFGRDYMANLFIIISREFGTEIFKVENGSAEIQINEEAMRNIWDYYYIPYISGYFFSYGRFRSDDAKVGDILAYIGSTSSASYFPSEVTAEQNIYSITAKILPYPHFENGQRVLVQQGAGMVVAKSTPEEEYASVEFLKWYTQTHNNIEFAAATGYMPVKKEAVDYDLIISQINETGTALDPITDETLRISLDEIKTSQLYTNKAFSGGADARRVLEYDLQDKAVADRQAVLSLLESGSSLKEALTQFNTDEAFRSWLEDFGDKLSEAVQ